jgi:anti-sigma factor RsiW
MIITCKQLVRRVTDAREGRLSAVDRAGYQLHLLRCRHCRTYVAQIDAIVAALHDASSVEAAPAELHAALARAFRARKP